MSKRQDISLSLKLVQKILKLTKNAGLPSAVNFTAAKPVPLVASRRCEIMVK